VRRCCAIDGANRSENPPRILAGMLGVERCKAPARELASTRILPCRGALRSEPARRGTRICAIGS